MAKGKRESTENRVLALYNESAKAKQALVEANNKQKEEEGYVSSEDEEPSIFATSANAAPEIGTDLAALFELARNQMTFDTEIKESSGESTVNVRPDWTFRYHLVAHQRHEDKKSVPLRDVPVNFDEDILSALSQMGITDAFAIQRAVFPFLMPRTPVLDSLSTKAIPAAWAVQSGHLSSSTCDVCVAAPTGQGKTLAFCLPLIHALKGRVVPALRAIIVLPTKELATQVHKVFTQISSKLTSSSPGIQRLRAALLVGSTRCQEEESLVETGGQAWDIPDVIVCTPGRMVELVTRLDEIDANVYASNSNHNHAGEGEEGFDEFAVSSSMLDTSGETSFGRVFGNLKILVLDEADRILAQPVVGWLTAVRRIDHFLTHANKINSNDIITSNSGLSMSSSFYSANSVNHSSGLRKWLFSATLTHKAEHLAAIALKRPLFFMTAGGGGGETAEKRGFALPKELSQTFAVCVSLGSKVVTLAWRLMRHWLVNNGKQVIVFTATKETGHRLSRLLQLIFSLDIEDFKFADGKMLADVKANEVAGLEDWEKEAGDAFEGVAAENDNFDNDFYVHTNNNNSSGGYYDDNGTWYDNNNDGGEGGWGPNDEEMFEEEDEGASKRRKKLEREAKRKAKKVEEVKVTLQKEEDIQRKKALEDYQDEMARSLALLFALRQQYPDISHQIRNFSSDMSEQMRRQTLSKFSKGEVKLLISSDVGSRGLDVLDIDLVVNYDLPSNSRRYVHRAGRTARAGQTGTVLSLVTASDISHLKKLVSETGGFESLNRVKTPRRAMEDLARLMPACMHALRVVLDAERVGSVAVMDGVKWGDKVMGGEHKAREIVQSKMKPLWDLFYNPEGQGAEEEDTGKSNSRKEKRKERRKLGGTAEASAAAAAESLE